MIVGSQAIGSRMVIRHATGGTGPSGGPAMTDVLGRIIAVSDTEVTVDRRDGSVAIIDLGSIVTAKVVPLVPRRSRDAHRIGTDDLGRICSRGWPPLVSSELGDWQLRAAGGFTRRANSAAVLGDPGRPVAEAITAVQDFYASHGLPARAQVIGDSEWAADFAAARWQPDPATQTVVLVANMTDAIAATAVDQSDQVQGDQVQITSSASDAWLGRYRRPADPEDPATARAVLERPHTTGFVTLGDQAIGRVVVTGEWAGIGAVHVLPEYRRRGAGRRVVDASLRWAAERGADKVYLQVAADNTAALALYASYGFREHHTYRYLSPPR